MTPAQLSALKSEIQTDPLAIGYLPYRPNDPQHIADLMNAIGTAKCLKPRSITARTILSECSGGGTILDALDRASAGIVTAPMTLELQSSIKWALKFLGQDSGVDAGNPATQSLIDACVSVGTLTTVQGAALKNTAMVACSRAETLGLGSVTARNIVDSGAN